MALVQGLSQIWRRRIITISARGSLSLCETTAGSPSTNPALIFVKLSEVRMDTCVLDIPSCTVALQPTVPAGLHFLTRSTEKYLEEREDNPLEKCVLI